jgi:tetratricopeptide (TPR) repeat protein
MKKQSKEELDDKLYKRLVKVTEQGNQFYDAGDYRKALAKFEDGLAMRPEPIEKWEAATWCLASIGDSLFLLGRYPEAHEHLSHAMVCPDGLGNPFIHMRLGQVQLELGNIDRAKDELARAYMGGGPELFAQEDPKYLAFLRRYMRGI